MGCRVPLVAPRRLVAAVLFGLLLDGTNSSAQVATPVVVTLLGPHSVLLEVATGVVRPCDSTSNRRLFRGAMNPGETITFQSPASCVCWRQTYANFPSVNLSSSPNARNTGFSCSARLCMPNPNTA